YSGQVAVVVVVARRGAVGPSDQRLRVHPDRGFHEHHRTVGRGHELSGSDQGQETRHDRLFQRQTWLKSEQVAGANGQVAVLEVVRIHVEGPVGEQHLARALRHDPVARVQWRMERGADEPVEPAVPDAVELDRAVVGDHLPLLQEPLAPLELHAEGVVIDVVVGRQGRRVEDGGAAGALKSAHSFSSEAWTKTAPLPLSSSWNASPEPRPTMSRQPSAVDSRLRTSPWWATYACGSTCTARCGVIGSSITPPCAMTATAPCPRRVVVNSPCPETWPRTIPITPPCEPRKTVPCSRVPSKASRRSASTYRVSPERSITWMWWPPCPNSTVPLPSTVIRGVASPATRRPIIDRSPPCPPVRFGVKLTSPW